MATPARRAISSSGASVPRSTPTSRAAPSSCSRLRRASARSRRAARPSSLIRTTGTTGGKPSGNLACGHPRWQRKRTAILRIHEESSVMDDVRAIQDRFDRAERRGDRESLRQLIADDFLSIGPRGFVLDKQGWIDRHDEFTYQQLQTSEMDLRHYGDATVVRDVQRNQATYRDQHVAVNTRVSQVWVRQQERWRLVAIQF